MAPHIAAGGGDGRSTQYDLYGVVNHMGRLLGGHYTAYARTMCDQTQSEIGGWLPGNLLVDFANNLFAGK